MAVKLRMKRLGNAHRPFYRVVSVDERRKRDGRVIEELGTFNPVLGNEAEQAKLKLDRCAYWLSVGAQPSQTVATLLKRHGLVAKAGTRLEDQPEDLEAAASQAMEQLAAEHAERERKKAEEKAKAEAEAKAKAEAEAKAAEAKAAEEAAAAESTEGEGEGDAAAEAPAEEASAESQEEQKTE